MATIEKLGALWPVTRGIVTVLLTSTAADKLTRLCSDGGFRLVASDDPQAPPGLFVARVGASRLDDFFALILSLDYIGEQRLFPTVADAWSVTRGEVDYRAMPWSLYPRYEVRVRHPDPLLGEQRDGGHVLLASAKTAADKTKAIAGVETFVVDKLICGEPVVHVSP